jgi:hypothetical protein
LNVFKNAKYKLAGEELKPILENIKAPFKKGDGGFFDDIIYF